MIEWFGDRVGRAGSCGALPGHDRDVHATFVPDGAGSCLLSARITDHLSPMNEEEAVFGLGKKYSALRNHGHELPGEEVRVGGSMVTPEELADEYDRHFPPGPPTPRQDSDRTFHYETVPLYEFRMGAYAHGLVIRHGDREFDVLKKVDFLRDGSSRSLRERIRTNRSNRFDVVEGDDFTYVIDKNRESMSVLRAKYKINGFTVLDESPIAGNGSFYLEDARGVPLGNVTYPFVPFGRFWEAWSDYVTRRKAQVDELRRSVAGEEPLERGAEVLVWADDPERRLQNGQLGRVVERLGNGKVKVDFGGSREWIETVAEDQLVVDYSDRD